MAVQYLCIEGFLTCRKNAERIILLVEMMQVSHNLSVGVASQVFGEIFEICGFVVGRILDVLVSRGGRGQFKI